ncbi:sugar phosphate isomerase/epimerase family protein [Occultella gossypii]|uniref:Sugar phosphate isomerase/epimerase n=1 Tax=Occultella gossypii TaxID=2800820 RepID=A0ABS7S2V4_9MICO|nr:sugar phosphate isomerase/epimerase [Occultella gossypii]MBZ2194674.1 sugar phosphate isomerase/epimerase [Occultella gossypii]
MIKISAHTMATPEETLPEAIDLFAELGFDGVELICADDYPCGIGTDVQAGELRTVRRAIEDHGLEVPNLVPYVREINVIDAQVRRRCIDDLLRCIDFAVALGAASVRIWAGTDPEPGHEDEQYALLIDSLQQLAPVAGAAGVVLSVENHMGSHAITGAITAGIVTDVGSAHVGVLYDPANLLVLGDSDYRAALEVQLPHITHVHFKDVDVLGDNRHMPRIVGEGEVPWAEILPALSAAGYDRFVTTEYEKRWHPDELPPSREGLAHELAAARRMLDLTGGRDE